MKNPFEDLLYVLEYYKYLGFDSVYYKTLKESNDYEIILKAGNTPPKNNYEGSQKYLTAEEKLKALERLREELGDCKRCRLSEGRKNIVFGEGNENTSLMFIGEAPGREEDIQGRPFVGQAGQILTNLINKMGKELGFTRADVYIANIVKCRPPKNRDPQPDEIILCNPFIKKQIEIISPSVIMSLGRISTYTLMGLTTPINKFSISQVRGQLFYYKTNGMTIPVIPTFHPAYFLRNPKDKHLTWSDALKVLDILKRKSP